MQLFIIVILILFLGMFVLMSLPMWNKDLYEGDKPYQTPRPEDGTEPRKPETITE
ncbi:hypothetical protein MASR2M15_24710 [Anaerolineales bacterium]